MCLIREEWRDIPDYEDLYQVSNWGRVKSLERTIICQDGSKRTYKSKVLKQNKDNLGYCRITLPYKNSVRTFLVHRLVAKSFLEPIEGKDIINHKDQNPSNNRVENLEWVTQQYNCIYNNAHIKRGEKIKGKFEGKNNPFYGKQHTNESKKKMSTPIIQYSKDNVLIKEFESITQASTELNILKTSICNCLKGKSKTCGNYFWRYKDIT